MGNDRWPSSPWQTGVRVAEMRPGSRLAGLGRPVQLLLLAATFALGGILSAFLLESGIAGKVKHRLTSLLPPELAAQAGARHRKIETGLLTLSVMEIPIGNVDGNTASGGIATGGGIAAAGDTLIFVTALGKIGYLDLRTMHIRYLPDTVPMNLAGLAASPAWQMPDFNGHWFRVTGILLSPIQDGQAQLYVGHHVYDERGDICLSISETTIHFDDHVPAVTAPFRQTYRANACVNLEAAGYNFEGHLTGGRLALLDDTSLLLTVGYFGLAKDNQTPGEAEANLPGDFGRLLRIDLESGEVSEFAKGFRNAQGITVDSLGRIWTTEHGPQGGDEINLVREGAHYGWPHVTFGVGYGGASSKRQPWVPNPVQGRHDGYEAPAFAFVPSIGINQIIEAPSTDESLALWQGDLLVASLREQSLYRLRLIGDTPVYVEPIRLNYRLRDMAALDGGRFAILTDERRILIVEEAAGGDALAPPVTIAARTDALLSLETASGRPDDNQFGRDMFRFKCGSCHTFEARGANGPHLGGILDRPIGSQPNYPYSPALTGATGRWSRNQLMRYIRDPASAGLEGSTMPAINHIDDYTLRAIIQYANEQPALQRD